jgi:hypothetical protein
MPDPTYTIWRGEIMATLCRDDGHRWHFGGYGDPARDITQPGCAMVAAYMDARRLNTTTLTLIDILDLAKAGTPDSTPAIVLAAQVAQMRQSLVSSNGQRDEALAVCRLLADALKRSLYAGGYVALRPDDAALLAAELAKIGVTAL